MPGNKFVVKIVTAGKAGLESLPHFLDEFLSNNIPMLMPNAIENDPATILRLEEELAKRQEFFQKHGYEINRQNCLTRIQSSRAVEARIERYKSIFAEKDSDREGNQMLDRPPALAQWAIMYAPRLWLKYLNEWKHYQAYGHSDADHLIIVVPYCPEGPTSGTIGMVLAAALKEQVKLSRRSGTLSRDKNVSIWGIELCPPVLMSDDAQSETRTNNVFRGYVARSELFNGVEVTKEGGKRERPFDVSIAIDGSNEFNYIPHIPANEGLILTELDKVAARIVVAVLQGALADDFIESIDRLQRCWRWHAYLCNVNSDKSLAMALSYLNGFPGFSADSESFNAKEVFLETIATSEKAKNDFFSAALRLVSDWSSIPGVQRALTGTGIPNRPWRVTTDIVNELGQAANAWSTRFEEYSSKQEEKEAKENSLKSYNNDKEKLKGSRWWGDPDKEKRDQLNLKIKETQKNIEELNEELKKIADVLIQTVGRAERAYSRLYGAVVSPNAGNRDLVNNLRSVPFGVVLDFDLRMAREYLEQGNQQSLAKLLGDGGAEEISNQLVENRLVGLLTQYIWDPMEEVEKTQEGNFSRILLVPIGHMDNTALLPPRETLALHARDREDLIEINTSNEQVQQMARRTQGEGFNLDFSVLLFAEGAKLEDVCSYQRLAETYHKIKSDINVWYEMMRYHVDVPEELREHHRLVMQQQTVKTFGGDFHRVGASSNLPNGDLGTDD